MNKKFYLFFLLSSIILSGCWTFNETTYPSVECSRAKNTATNLTLAVNGFESVFVDYEAITGYSTVYVPSRRCRRYWVPGTYETVSTVSYVPTRRSTDIFLTRARELFEESGFLVGGSVPRVSVEVKFEGPFTSSTDFNRSLLWSLGTIFFCDYSSQEWTAKLRIRDNTTGKLLFHREYSQRYEANVFSLIPLFGPTACRETSPAQMQSWCLFALTERTVADATAFLSTIE